MEVRRKDRKVREPEGKGQHDNQEEAGSGICIIGDAVGSVLQ